MILAVPALLLVVQILLFQVVFLIEGRPDPSMTRLTPLTILVSGVSTAVMALLATLLIARFAKVSWRSIFRHDRLFDWHRMGVYLVVSAGLVGLSMVVFGLIAPEATGWSNLDVGAVTIGIILTTLVGSPLQAAGEEIGFRGVVAPAAGSFFRGMRPAIACAIVVSGISFAVVHVSLEPWFVSYLMVFSACTILMGVMSGGLEAAMALHISNNVLYGIVNALFAGNDATVIDRGAGSGPGPAYLILMVMNITVVGAVWLIERRKRLERRAGSAAR